MAWYDAGAILLGVVCALAGVALIVGLLGLVYVCVTAWWPWQKPPPPAEAKTPMGTFRKHTNDWELVDEDGFTITVHDVVGVPDPVFLARLPELLAELPRYERIARESYDFEADKSEFDLAGEPFKLSSLSQTDEGFTLAFDADEEENDLGTVFVDFADGRVVGSTLVH